VLKLVYHTGVLGPIDLEYEQPFVRVGSSPDNDLVLPHKTIAPYHCLLVFHGEKLLVLPPSRELPSAADLQTLRDGELGLGDSFTIGEVEFTLAHSSKTVALPELPGAPPAPRPPEDATRHRYFCPHCQRVVPEAELRHVGLVGHPSAACAPSAATCSIPNPPLPRPRPHPPPRNARSSAGKGGCGSGRKKNWRG
jgi:hypothetical protein